MPRWNLCSTASLSISLTLVFAFAGASPARTQTAPVPATPLTPAQQKALAAKQARQAAAEKAAENRATAAQNRAAAAHSKTSTATPTNTGANTGSAALNGTANTTGGSSSAVANPAARPAAAAPTSPNTSAAAVGAGTLAWQTRLYTSTGCVHQGNSAVCTFTFVNQGNAGTLVAGAEMGGIQLVDDAHVPHRAQSAHFLDKYGTQQPRLLVQPGDSGTYVLTFANVNSQVATADFHLRQQIVGGVTFSSGTAATPAAAPTAKKP